MADKISYFSLAYSMIKPSTHTSKQAVRVLNKFETETEMRSKCLVTYRLLHSITIYQMDLSVRSYAGICVYRYIQTCNKSKLAFINRVTKGFYLHFIMRISIQILNNNRVTEMFINTCANDVEYSHVAWFLFGKRRIHFRIFFFFFCHQK